MSQSYYWILSAPTTAVSRTVTGVDVPWTPPEESDPRIHIGKQAVNVMYWAQKPADVCAFCRANPSMVAVRSETYGNITCAEFLGHVKDLRDDLRSLGERFS